ncbi:unnamed protein product, partial [Prorocentrum cordatum]
SLAAPCGASRCRPRHRAGRRAAALLRRGRRRQAREQRRLPQSLGPVLRAVPRGGGLLQAACGRDALPSPAGRVRKRARAQRRSERRHGSSAAPVV